MHRPDSDPTEPSRWETILRYVVLAGIALVPLVFSFSGEDHFRFPKELLLRAVALLVIAVGGAGLVLQRITIDERERRNLRRIAIVAAAGFVWTLLAAATSTQRLLSVEATIWVAVLIVVFFAATHVLRRLSLPVLAAVVLVPALVNAGLVLLQGLRIWNPWRFDADIPVRMHKNALLGNPDDVGVYLAGAALLAFGATLFARRFRALYGLALLILIAGLLMTETLTALGGFTAGALLLLWTVKRPRGRIIVGVLAGAVVIAIFSYGPTRGRIAEIAGAAMQREWGVFARGRLVPLATTWRMFADRPLTGVGPGAFKFNYMEYRILVEHEHPRFSAVAQTVDVNFAEAHNDHAQILAETGVPGLLAAWAALGLLAMISFKRIGAGADERTRVVHRLALPFAAMIAVIMIAQFPWHLAAPSVVNLAIGAACFAWRDEDDA